MECKFKFIQKVAVSKNLNKQIYIIWYDICILKSFDWSTTLKPLWIYNTHPQKQKIICNQKPIFNSNLTDFDAQINFLCVLGIQKCYF